MSNDTEDLTQETENDSDLVKRLRAEIKQRDNVISEKDQALTETQKENAFRAAGIDPTAGTGKLLFKAYDGEFDKDSVVGAAQEYGITPGEQQAPAQQTTEEDEEMQQQRQADAQANKAIDEAASGPPAGAKPDDPEALSREAYDRTIQQTGNREAAMAAAFDAKARNAVEQQKKS